MSNKVITYSDSCDYTVVSNFQGIFPKQGKKYFAELKNCPYCSSSVTFKELHGYATTKGLRLKKILEGNNGLNSVLLLTLCLCNNPLCGWWALEQVEYQIEIGRTESEIKWGQIKTFDTSSIGIPIQILRTEIMKNPNIIHSAHHNTFERLMADCIKDKFPGSYVKHVGKSHDGGIDIFSIINNETFLIQVKRRKDGSIPEGPKAIRELNGVLLREGIYKGIFISTAKRFTEAAYGELKIKMETKKPVEVQLISLDGIIELISNGFKEYEPWKDYVEKL